MISLFDEISAGQLALVRTENSKATWKECLYLSEKRPADPCRQYCSICGGPTGNPVVMGVLKTEENGSKSKITAANRSISGAEIQLKRI
jgi:hypothetical protein